MCISVCGKGAGFLFQLPVPHTHPTLCQLAFTSSSAYCLPTFCSQPHAHKAYCDTQILVLSAVSFPEGKRLEHNKDSRLHFNATPIWPEKYEA